MAAPAVLVLGVFVRSDVIVRAQGFADVVGQALDLGQGLRHALIAGERGREPVHVRVVGAGPVGEVRVQAQAVVEERGLRADGVLGLPVGVFAAAGAVQDVTDRIDGAVGQGAVRVEDRGAGVAFIRDVAPDVAARFALRLGHHVLAPGDVGVGRDLEPGRDLVAHLHAAVVHPVGVGVHLTVEQTVVVVQTGGHVVVELVVRAGHGDVVRLGEREVLVQDVVVVRARVVVEPASGRADGAVGHQGLVVAGRGPLAVFLQPGGGELHRLVDRGRVAALVVVPGVIEVLRPDITVGDDVRHRGRGLEGEVRLVIDRRRPLLRVLGRDEHDAVRGAGTVDGRGRGVLEDGHALDVVRVQEARVAFDTVDQDQRAAALADGGLTADVEGRGGIRTAVGELEVQVRDAALQHLRQVRVRTSVEGVRTHLVHGAGEVRLLLRSVTDHHRFIQHLGVGIEDDVDPHAALDRDGDRLEADALEGQVGIGRNGDGVVAVHVGSHSVRRSFLHDTSTDDR